MADSLSALSWLKRRDCPRIYFKYCSTFDSTPRGNIGPVTDAVLGALDLDSTVVCPSLPANGRTVRGGILYVNGVPLSETGMRHHPLNPMTDSDLPRLMQAQSRGKAEVIGLRAVRSGPEAVTAEMDRIRSRGGRLAVLDAETDADMDILGAAFRDAPFLTGGSSLGAAVARRLYADGLVSRREDAARMRGAGGTVALSGSCSETTNRQTAAYRETAPCFPVAVDQCLENAAGYAARAAEWVSANSSGRYAPLVNATVGPEELRDIQERCGAVSHLHSTYLTALSCLEGLNPENVMEAFTPYYAMKVGRLIRIPYYRPGSPELGEKMVAEMRETKAFLLANHGQVMLGETLEEAVNNSEELEETAKLWFILRGMDYRKLTLDEVRKLQ